MRINMRNKSILGLLLAGTMTFSCFTITLYASENDSDEDNIGLEEEAGIIENDISLDSDDDSEDLPDFYIENSSSVDDELIIDDSLSDNDVAASVQLYAQAQSMVTITFDYNGGIDEDGANSKTVEVQLGEEIWIPEVWQGEEDPHKDGFALSGWSETIDGDVTIVPDGKLKATSNVTLYAVWETGYVITLDPNGGYWEDDDDNQITSPMQIRVAKGYYASAEEPYSDSYVFGGWNSSPSGNGDISFDYFIFPTGDITLYARWLNSKVITFDANGGYYYDDNDNVVSSIDVRMATGTEINWYDCPEPNNDNDTQMLLGWSTSKSAKDLIYNRAFKQESGRTLDDVDTLYSIWVPYHTVMFIGNGQLIGGKSESCINYTGWPECAVGVPEYFIPETLKSQFVGWSTTPDGENPFDFEKQVVTTDMTVYAIWKSENEGGNTGIHEHTWDNGLITVAPTCAKTGIKVYTCTQDSSHTRTEVIPATGNHTPVIDKAVPATTSSTGLSEGSHCSVCNKVLVEQKIIPKLTVPTNIVDQPSTVTIPISNKILEPITIPKTPTSVKAKAKKNKVTVTWKKFKQTKKTKAIWKKITNVEVQCSTDKNFQLGVTIKLLGKKKTKVKLTLQKKTTYYVRVRYKGSNGFSKWSAVKKVTTKK